MTTTSIEQGLTAGEARGPGHGDTGVRHRVDVPRWLAALAMVLVITVVLSSFALSFAVLADLAALSGIPADVAWLWPVIVDGTITAATLVHYTSRARGQRHVLPLVTLIVFGLASVIGNISHIMLVDPSKIIPVAIAVFVGVMPPVGLILTVELLGSLLRSRERGTPRRDDVIDEIASDQRDCTVVTAEAREAPVSEAVTRSVTDADTRVTGGSQVEATADGDSHSEPGGDSSVSPFELRGPAESATDAPVARLHAFGPDELSPTPERVPVEKAEQIEWIVARARTDRDVSREAIATCLGVSVRTAQRRLAEAREQAPDVFEMAS